MAAPRRDLAGQQFGRLTVTTYAGDGHWNAQCACGNVTTVRTDRLTSGQTRSCGCLARERNKHVAPGSGPTLRALPSPALSAVTGFSEDSAESVDALIVAARRRLEIIPQEHAALENEEQILKSLLLGHQEMIELRRSWLDGHIAG